MQELIVNSLQGMVQVFLDLLTQFLPRLVVMLILIVVGWVMAAGVEWLVRRLLLLLRFEKVSENVGATRLLSQAAMPPPTELVSKLVFYVVWLSFLLLGISALGITALQEMIARFLGFLPQVFVALVILFVGLLAANFFSRAALLAAVNANLPSARLVSAFVRFIIALLAITMALEQIALAQSAVLIAFSIVFGAVMLGVAIALGIGGQHVVRRLLEKQFLDQEEEKQEEVSPL